MAQQVILNITFKVANTIAANWIDDLKKVILPESVDGKIILFSQISEVQSTDEDGKTYSIQFYYPNESVFKAEKLNSMRRFLESLDRSYAGQYVYFPTTLNLVHIYNPNS